MSGRPITVSGVKYKNLRDAYEELKPDVSISGLRARLKSGLSPDEAFLCLRYSSKKSSAKPVILKGIKYNSIAEAYREIKPEVKYQTVLRRISKGEGPEEALTTPKIDPLETYSGKKAGVTINGVEYASIKEAYYILKPEIGIKCIYTRVRRGYSLEEAFSDKPKVSKKQVTVFGVEYSSLKEAYEAIQPEVTYSCVYSRIQKGEPLDIAFSRPWTPEHGRQSKYKGITVQGKEYSCLKEAYRDINPGISYCSIVTRLKSGYSVEDAFSGTLNKSMGRGYNSRNSKYHGIVVDGIKYNSIRHACSVMQNGVKEATVYYRRAMGYSLEDAFKIPTTDSSITLFGKKYSSIGKAYKELKPEISYEKVRARLEAGWSVEDAFRLPASDDDHVRAPRLKLERGGTGSGCSMGHPVEVDGKVFRSLASAYEHYQYKACVSYGTVVERMRVGMPFKQAMVMPSRNGGLWVRGEWFNSAREAIEHYGADITISCALKRIRSGLTPEQALGLEPSGSNMGELNK